MKRVILCIAILLVIMLLCTASLVTTSRYQYVLTQEVRDLEQAIYQKTFEPFRVSQAWLFSCIIFPC